ncbi:MAG: hypothetical protein HQL50_01580 [Magnetococcales bacterium]|nr:hypothetical protein [Magnetococcales bacterium]
MAEETSNHEQEVTKEESGEKEERVFTRRHGKWILGAWTVLITMFWVGGEVPTGRLIPWVITFGYFEAPPGKGLIPVGLGSGVLLLAYYLEGKLDQIGQREGAMQKIYWPLYVYFIFVSTALFMMVIGPLAIAG